MGGDKLLDQIFNLKFTAKQLARSAIKCEKEEKAEKLRVKKAIEKGNMEGAKIYAQNAIRKKNEQLNYMKLASRLDATVSRLETQAKMQMVSGVELTVRSGLVPPAVYGGRLVWVEAQATQSSLRLLSVRFPQRVLRKKQDTQQKSLPNKYQNAVHHLSFSAGEQEHGGHRQEPGEGPRVEQPGDHRQHHDSVREAVREPGPADAGGGRRHGRAGCAVHARGRGVGAGGAGGGGARAGAGTGAAQRRGVAPCGGQGGRPHGAPGGASGAVEDRGVGSSRSSTAWRDVALRCGCGDAGAGAVWKEQRELALCAEDQRNGACGNLGGKRYSLRASLYHRLCWFDFHRRDDRVTPVLCALPWLGCCNDQQDVLRCIHKSGRLNFTFDYSWCIPSPYPATQVWYG